MEALQPQGGGDIASSAHRWRHLAATYQVRSHLPSPPPPGSTPRDYFCPAHGLIQCHFAGYRACSLEQDFALLQTVCPERPAFGSQSELVMRASASRGFLERATLKQTEAPVSSRICTYRKQRSGCFLLSSEPRLWPFSGLWPPNKGEWMVQNWPHYCLN